MSPLYHFVFARAVHICFKLEAFKTSLYGSAMLFLYRTKVQLRNSCFITPNHTSDLNIECNNCSGYALLKSSSVNEMVSASPEYFWEYFLKKSNS